MRKTSSLLAAVLVVVATLFVSEVTCDAAEAAKPCTSADLIAMEERIKLLIQPGWINGPGGYQFFVATSPKNWLTVDKAKKFCVSKGGRLLMEGARDPKLRLYLHKNFFSRTSKGKFWWIDITDSEVEGTWKWGDGTGVTWSTNWLRNQPDNHNGADCVVINKYRKFKWDDVRCSNKGSVICERRV